MRFLGLLTAMVLAGVVWLASAPTAELQEVTNCSEFVSQAQAQAFFRANPSATNLDADSDGIACEANDCPCDYVAVGGRPAAAPTAEPAPAPAPAVFEGSYRVVIVSQEVYDYVYGAYQRGEDAGAAYRAITGRITPPNAGDAGLHGDR